MISFRIPPLLTLEFSERLIVKHFVIFPLLYLVSVGASAEIFRHVDPIAGNITLSNVPPHRKVSTKRAARAFKVAPARTSYRLAANTSPLPGPADFPRVTADQQHARDSERRQILMDELQAEQEAFEKAKERNAPDAEIDTLRGNIAALERELDRTQ